MSEEFDDPDREDGHAAVIGLVGSAFDEGRAGRAVQDVLLRGRKLQRRKRATSALGALSVVGVSAVLALALTGPTSAGAGHTLKADDGTVVNVDDAGFSVHTDTTTGKITVTIRQMSDPNVLKQILAKAGIRTVFASQTGRAGADGGDASCTWPGASKLNPDGVIFTPTAAGNPSYSPAPDTVIIDRSRMPQGSVLAFDYLKIANGSVTATTLLSGEPTGCTA